MQFYSTKCVAKYGMIWWQIAHTGGKHEFEWKNFF